jgi:hypothetical protein
MDKAYLDIVRAWLVGRGITFEEGLRDTEVNKVEKTLGASIPPDLRAFLQHALPVSNGFPNWRKLDSDDLQKQLRWPMEGVLFDVAHNGVWFPEWGSKPVAPAEIKAVVEANVRQAPTLIPIYKHRYMPAEPNESGNPVLSVWQLDIICYGNDLPSYFAAEFGIPIPSRLHARANPKVVRFWLNE